MGLDHPASPDWHARDEHELECLCAGEDEGAARAALAELGRRHDHELRVRTRHLCGGDAELIGQAMQELEVRVRVKRKLYHPDRGRWIAWAKTILRHIVVDLFRRRARLPGPPPRPPVGPDAPPGDPMDQFPGREPPPDWRLKLHELQQAMNDCRERLPPEERDALTLQVVENLSLEEIAGRTGVRRATAGTRAYRARQRMRECLERKGYKRGEV
jgi:RNA polymerase sigma factor (sigma-70 family)